MAIFKQVVVGAALLVGSWDPRAEQVETEKGGGRGIHPQGLKMVPLHSFRLKGAKYGLKQTKQG